MKFIFLQSTGSNISVQYIKLFGVDGTTEIFPESVTGTGQSGTTTDTINYDIHPVNVFDLRNQMYSYV